MEKQLLGRFPNTYAFTKRLCEALIVREWQLRNGTTKEQQQQQTSLLGDDLSPFHFPICFLRPSIIGCAYKHPKRGWIDNINATGGMLLLCRLQLLLSLLFLALFLSPSLSIAFDLAAEGLELRV